MDLERARQVLELLGCEKFYVSEQETADGPRTLLRSNCPLARFRHDRREDRHPSFALIQKAGKDIHYSCLACNSDGSLVDLMMTIRYEAKKIHNQEDNLLKQLEKLNNEINSLVVSQEIQDVSEMLKGVAAKNGKNDITKIKENFPCLPDEVSVRLKELQAALWSTPFVLKYLFEERKLTPETVRDFGLGWAEEVRRVIVPQYDTDGRLVNLGGRYLGTIFDYFQPNKWFHTKGFRREAFLFGEDRLDRHDGHATIFLVEGMFDAIYLTQKGLPNVMAVLGTELANLQAKKLSSWADRVVVLFDGDKPGLKAAQKVVKQLTIKEPWIHQMQEGKDPDELTDFQIEKIKERYL